MATADWSTTHQLPFGCAEVKLAHHYSSDILRRSQKFEKISQFYLTIVSKSWGIFSIFCGHHRISEL